MEVKQSDLVINVIKDIEFDNKIKEIQKELKTSMNEYADGLLNEEEILIDNSKLANDFLQDTDESEKLQEISEVSEESKDESEYLKYNTIGEQLRDCLTMGEVFFESRNRLKAISDFVFTQPMNCDIEENNLEIIKKMEVKTMRSIKSIAS